MFLWAGIDEAGYGPLLGPLVMATTCFKTRQKPSEGFLWGLLADSISHSLQGLDGRIMVADSKLVYSRSKGLKRLEETVLTFSCCLGSPVEKADDLLSLICQSRAEETAPWFEKTADLKLPVSTNRASIASKTAILKRVLAAEGVRFTDVIACTVLPAEYNRIVGLTGNKSALLWQNCGILLLYLWKQCDEDGGFVLVDSHGGRRRYRKLLKDAFPLFECDIVTENSKGSVYCISGEDKNMWVAFKPKADSCSVPVSLASMFAKYVRELYMKTFNDYWSQRHEGLRPTAGYAADAKRFLLQISPMLKQQRVDMSELVRSR